MWGERTEDKREVEEGEEIKSMNRAGGEAVSRDVFLVAGREGKKKLPQLTKPPLVMSYNSKNDHNY